MGQHCKSDPNYIGSGIILQEAILKYGRENFKRETIYYCASKEIMDRLEIETIKRYKEAGYEMYNIHEGGTGGDTMKYASDENKKKKSKKISEAIIGENNPFYKKNHTEETINKISKTLTGIKHTEERNKAKSERMKGIPSNTKGTKRSLKTQLKMDITFAKKRLYENKYPNRNGFTRESDLEFLKLIGEL